MLKEHGINLHRPFADILEGGIHELRMKLSGDQTRILYFFCYRDYIILTHDFVKTSDKVPMKDVWWIGRKKDDLTTSNAYAETYTAAGRLLFWQTWSLTPNWSFREDTRLAQKLRTRTTATTAGSGLALMRGELVEEAFKPTPLFWMHFNGFDANYGYRKSITFDFRDKPTNVSESHSASAGLPLRGPRSRSLR